VAFKEIPFLGEKIGLHWTKAMTGVGGYQVNRFGNMLYDYDFILKRPLFGWSVTPQTRVATDMEIPEHVASQGNGLTGFMVRFGVLGFLGYLIAVWRSASGYFGSSASGAIVVSMISLLLMGEQFLNFPLFYVLAFAPRRSGPGLHQLSTLAVPMARNSNAVPQQRRA